MRTGMKNNGEVFLMPPSLRKIIVSIGYDNNGNGTLLSDEVEVTLATYIARRW